MIRLLVGFVVSSLCLFLVLFVDNAQATSLLITRFGDNVVDEYGLDGTFIRTFASATAQPGSLSSPIRLAQNGPGGDVFVLNIGTSDVTRFEFGNSGPGGEAAVVPPDPFASGGHVSGRGIEFGPNGNLFVSAFGTNNVVEYDATTGALVGTYATTAGQPQDLAFDAGGDLFVANVDGTQGIFRFDASGTPLGLFADRPGSPSSTGGAVGLEFAPNGHLFATFSYSNGFAGNFVSEFDASGTYLGDVFTYPASGAEQAIDLEFAPNGNLYVARYSSGTIDELQLGLPGAAASVANSFVVSEGASVRVVELQQVVPEPSTCALAALGLLGLGLFGWQRRGARG
ncbi:MAG: PEP-CTERM sorting domain-containing protein [Planctomycetota bacterium]|nr:MAG: PEP-CTERM sorting domain-containing protein [Planctomycetota bacterium]